MEFKMINPRPSAPPFQTSLRSTAAGGFALIIVLSILVLLTALVIAFFSRVQTDLTSATAYGRGATTQHLADSAVNVVMTQIKDATAGFARDASGEPVTSIPLAWASQPGMIRTWDNSGKPSSFYKLYSSDKMVVEDGASFSMSDEKAAIDGWKGSGSTKEPYNALFADLNSPIIVSNSSGSTASTVRYPIVDPRAEGEVEGFSITSRPGFSGGDPLVGSPTDNPAPMPVKWLYFLEDGQLASATGSAAEVTVAGASSANPVVGRVAFWTDDETSKVNINTASEGTFWDVPRVQNREEHGTQTGPRYGYSWSVPTQNEFQRSPGHPATTSLSAVLGKLLPSPDYIAGSQEYAQLQKYYALTPRIAGGGTEGGTRAVFSASDVNLTLDRDRLYASNDELLFPPSRDRSVDPASALTPEIVERTRFFLTGSSRAPEVNLFNAPRLSLWPLQLQKSLRNTKDNLLAFCATIADLPYYFQRHSAVVTRANQSADELNKPFDGTDGSAKSLTADYAQVPRNQQLLNYLHRFTTTNIPGIGGNLDAKFANGDNEQILTEIFDYVRSGVNGMSQQLEPTYNYAPFGRDTAVGTGQVMPIHINLDGTQTKGFGNVYTIREVSIMFYASQWKDETTLNSTAPFTPSSGPDGVPDDEPDQNGNFDGVGDPRTTEMKAIVFISPYNVSPGQPQLAPALRFQIEGLNNLSVQYPASGGASQSLDFPAANQAVLLTRGQFLSSTSSEVGFFSQFGYGSKYFEPLPREPRRSDGRTSSLGGDDDQEKSFPWYTENPVTLNPPANPSQFGLTNTGGNKNIPRAPGQERSNFEFLGGELKIKVYSGYGNTFDDQDFIQEITVDFPSATLPVPQVVRSVAATNPKLPDSVAALRGGKPTDPEFYWGFGTPSTSGKFVSDSRDLKSRMTSSVPKDTTFNHPDGTTLTQTNEPLTGAFRTDGAGIFRRGDVIRSVQVSPSGPSRGDLRHIAALKNVPSSYFAPFPDLAVYRDSTRAQLHGHVLRPFGDPRGRDTLGYDITAPAANPRTWGPYAARDGLGKLVNVAYGSGTKLGVNLPAVSSGLTAARLIGASGSDAPGDWDNGFGNQYDGPYLNKPDQGYTWKTTGDATNIYYPGLGNIFNDEEGLTVGYSPTRQIPSPVMLGSLPTGVLSQKPWQTLLFSPNPAAASQHPGFGRGGDGATGVAARPPYTIPPDHVYLDLFWMPVVEPYAISEPLSTAGKVNLNYQIAPFNYIERKTGLHAVLKRMKILAIPDGAGAGTGNVWYKTELNAGNAALNTQTPSYRYDVNVEETLRGGFDARFNAATNPDIFRSASEITTVFLVPKAPSSAAGYPWPLPSAGPSSYSATAAWWGNYKLTGDNSRESPYNHIYPRLTTKSNTYRVHFRVQSLKKVSSSDPIRWNESRDIVESEYRGSTLIERYIDPDDPRLTEDGNVDFATLPITDPKAVIDRYYRFRVLEAKRFSP